MSRFVPPNGITKVTDAPSVPCLWPIGHAFFHEASNTFFRFISYGSTRGNPSFGISTSKGILCSTGYRDTQAYHFAWPPTGAVVSGPDKGALVARLVKALEAK